MLLQATYPIGVKRHLVGATDAHGNTSASFDAEEIVYVYSIAPTASDEPSEVGREAVITGLSVLAPANVSIDRLDRLVIDGDEWTVEGEIADWNRGPFSWTPGIQINLERVKG